MKDNSENLNVNEQENAQNYDNSDNQENPIDLEAIKLSYDGSNVISSHPFTNAFDSSDFQEAANKSEKEETQPAEAQQKKQEPEPEKNSDDIIAQNKALRDQLTKYEAMLGQILNIQPDIPQTYQANKKNADSDKADIEKVYRQGQQDAIKQTYLKMEQNRVFDEQVQELRKQNPDIAGDPVKEDIVGSIAMKYIHSGMDFVTSINKAIEDFRKVSGPSQPQNEKKLDNTDKRNIPQSRPYNQKNTPKNLYIEGASPSIPEKQFKSSELIDMQINRPDEYLRLQPQIMRAYQEGKVIFD